MIGIYTYHFTEFPIASYYQYDRIGILTANTNRELIFTVGELLDKSSNLICQLPYLYNTK